MNETGKLVVLSTCASEEEASRLARALVEKRLAACAAVGAKVTSMYHWQGRIEQSDEWPLTIKTTRELLPELMDELKRAHSYDVPEILALPVVDGNPDYLTWMERELSR